MIAGQPSTDLEYLRDMDERLRAVERRRPTISPEASVFDPEALFLMTTLGVGSGVIFAPTAVTLLTLTLTTGVWRVDAKVDAVISAGATAVNSLVVGQGGTIRTVPGIENTASADRSNIDAWGYVTTPGGCTVSLSFSCAVGSTSATAANTALAAHRIGAVSVDG